MSENYTLHEIPRERGWITWYDRAKRVISAVHKNSEFPVVVRIFTHNTSVLDTVVYDILGSPSSDPSTKVAYSIADIDSHLSDAGASMIGFNLYPLLPADASLLSMAKKTHVGIRYTYTNTDMNTDMNTASEQLADSDIEKFLEYDLEPKQVRVGFFVSSRYENDEELWRSKLKSSSLVDELVDDLDNATHIVVAGRRSKRITELMVRGVNIISFADLYDFLPQD